MKPNEEDELDRWLDKTIEEIERIMKDMARRSNASYTIRLAPIPEEKGNVVPLFR